MLNSHVTELYSYEESFLNLTNFYNLTMQSSLYISLLKRELGVSSSNLNIKLAYFSTNN